MPSATVCRCKVLPSWTIVSASVPLSADSPTSSTKDLSTFKMCV